MIFTGYNRACYFCENRWTERKDNFREIKIGICQECGKIGKHQKSYGRKGNERKESVARIIKEIIF